MKLWWNYIKEHAAAARTTTYSLPVYWNRRTVMVGRVKERERDWGIKRRPVLPWKEIYLYRRSRNLTISSRRSFSSSIAAADWDVDVSLFPCLSSSSCRVSSSTLATATDSSFSFSLNTARSDSRSEPVIQKNNHKLFHSLPHTSYVHVTVIITLLPSHINPQCGNPVLNFTICQYVICS